ncbi:anillin isoform X2 [Periophthalmus magnuspinnatus]|uniref:anillin isoform X2 n=1 Tax=Periophthalmus magnuspinnatus TaxID=409849 RepID=UPI00145A19C2|nr:anillin isoform X2 [Periophthalmus magnuspinnatus]
MDPFTEKLLERTRARRENLQKKLAERPNAANRQMVKRPREPLTETNSLICEPPVDKVPQATAKPSPSKRKCSGENLQPSKVDEENKEPMVPQALTPLLQDPPTDKKPPVGPASIRSTPSMERASRPNVPTEVEQVRRAEIELNSREEEKMEVATSLHQSRTEEEEKNVPSATGMRSRLQMLADQRKFWEAGDPEVVPDCAPLSMLKRQPDVPPSSTPSLSSGAPVGRKGRLANLAATICSWEDDLSHANIPKQTAPEKPSSVHKAPSREANSSVTSAGPLVTTAQDKSMTKTNQSIINSPVKASRAIPPSPQKAEAPPVTPSAQSPQKISRHELSSSSPQKDTPKPCPQSPLKNHLSAQPLGVAPSPHKPEIRVKPADLSASYQEKTTGTPSVKSFLERFGEKCNERANPSTPAGSRSQPKTPTMTSAVTPNTRLVQEKLRAAQTTKTTSADLTQRHKMERESELALIRNRFQKANNMWKNKDEGPDKTIRETVKPKSTSEESEAPSCHSDEPTGPSVDKSQSPTKSIRSGFLDSPPASTSSPLKSVSQIVVEPVNECLEEEKKQEEEVNETEMNVDGSVTSEQNVDASINSAVINELFQGVLEQSEEEEEEDPLNISSMSLLAPLVETVAAVAKSPDGMMTSTPASSFIVKSPLEKTPKTKLRRSLSSDSIHVLSPEHRLPYSIDAYRSTRVKDPERPSIKQVIVRKEDVSQRAEEPRGSNLFSVKQRMKVLTNEMNLQQTVIHQASQALNCCTDEEHGKGSQVEAEAERLLLVATEKREVLKAELDRLKGDPSGQKKAPAPPDSTGVSATRGSITLHELRLPLKADFVCSTANKPEAASKHSFFVMIRAGAENTVATPLASTHRGLSGDTLTFPTKFTMADVSSDFQIMIEVYCLVQKREMCADKKKKISKSKAITPKRFLAITKSGQTPVVASPGGPNAVRTSNFILVGSHKLTLSSIGKNKFPLEKIKCEGSERELLGDSFLKQVPFLCPLEGHIYMKLQCEVGSNVEEKGFLTMFEDVSGFGAWHRRWCVLSGYCISYWTYPDDERRKAPIGRINLANCTSKKVEPANREFCARPNTFELITVRPQREDDRETLVSQCMNTMCVTKNWLSADTKDERNLWMKKLNQILMDLRMWQPDSCCKPL